MIKLIDIEFFKLRNTRYFWVLSGLFVLFLIAVPIGVHAFLEWLTDKGENIADIPVKPNEIPIFDFVDIWQNMTWIYKYFSLFLGFIIVISVCNEFSYGTIKQNVIDGLSRKQLLGSKIGFIVAYSLVITLFATLILFIFGLFWSPVQGVSFVFENIEFMGGYFLHLVGFQLFCLTLALLIKRSGFVIALLTFYIYVVENIAANVVEYYYKLPDLASLFPMRAIGNIIPLPWEKYVLQESQNYIGLGDLMILLGYITILCGLSYWLVQKRDMK